MRNLLTFWVFLRLAVVGSAFAPEATALKVTAQKSRSALRGHDLQNSAADIKLLSPLLPPAFGHHCLPRSRLAVGSSAVAIGFLLGYALASRSRRACKRQSRLAASLSCNAKVDAAVTALRASSTAAIEEDLLPHYFPINPNEVYDPNDDELDAACVGGAEAASEICELIGFDMEDCLDREIGRDYDEEELYSAYKASGYFDAKPSKKPSAIWLIGPSACGKSTLAPLMADWIGLHEDGYVIVDGESFRDSHKGYQSALLDGKNHGCVWWGAYTGIRENINLEKQKLLLKTMSEKKHLMIPSTCLRSSQSVDVAQLLHDNGYTIHVVGVYGDKDTIVNRGRARAQQKGKRYDRREFEIALTMFAPMLRKCTGRYRMVCTTTGTNERFGTACQGDGPLDEAQVKHICETVFHGFRV